MSCAELTAESVGYSYPAAIARVREAQPKEKAIGESGSCNVVDYSPSPSQSVAAGLSFLPSTKKTLDIDNHDTRRSLLRQYKRGMEAIKVALCI
jgi:hypothetical protein